MRRFVVLRHETPGGYSRPTHFDLMLERGTSLRTWAFSEMPTVGQDLVAEELPDHRLDYLDFEGAVSGDRGCVTRVASGQYELIAESAGLLQFRLVGEQLAGDLTLIRDAAEPARWRLSLAPSPNPSAH